MVRKIIGDWIGDYRKVGEPACSISVKEADESGFLFSVEYPGAAALGDRYEMIARQRGWMNPQPYIEAVIMPLPLFLQTMETLQLAEIVLTPQEHLNIAGEYHADGIDQDTISLFTSPAIWNMIKANICSIFAKKV